MSRRSSPHQERWLAAPIGAAALIVLISLTACGGDQDVAVTLDFAGQSRAALVNYVLGIYAEPDCSFTQGAFPMGLTESTAEETQVRRQIFPEGGAAPIGELEGGLYAFLGLGLTIDCEIRYSGCVMATVGELDEVVIPMTVADDNQFCDQLRVRTCDEGTCHGF